MPLGHRWVQLFIATRITAMVTAAVLLSAHHVTDHDPLLIVIVLVWGSVTGLAAWSRPALFTSPVAWVVDAGVALGLVTASEDWRSPFYLLLLTTLAAPAATLPLRRALGWGAGFTLGYFAVAVITGLDVDALRTTARLDTMATHMLLPLVATGGIAYTADAMRRLATERGRSERLAIETERRRIAWELHDSAKQRLHAAALMLSSIEPAAGNGHGNLIQGALQEVRGATADMETSIAELRSPLEGRRLDKALRERAADLQPLTKARIHIKGIAPELPATTATHVYRIVGEALSNAVRHADADSVEIVLRNDDGVLHATITDDGKGLPETIRPGAAGLLTMRSRAFAIGGRLSIGNGAENGGTRVVLDLPLTNQGAPS